MKTHRKVVKSFSCETCGTKYRKPKDAKTCEQHPVEDAVAAIGDRVRIKEPRECLMSKSKKDRRYIAEGVITEISPPLPHDMEYELKWLGGDKKRLRSHVLSYIVSYRCPRCEEKRKQPVFAPEFTVLAKA